MNRWFTAVLCLLAVAGGFALRFWPCLRTPDFAFVADSAVHERLTREVVTRGRVAAVDRMSEAPEGRRTATQLPLALYGVGAAFHALLAALGSRDLRWNLAILTALAGALAALPAAFGAAAVFRDGRAAPAAALIAAILPAHLARTDGLSLRYDALGTLLVIAHVALALAALADPRPLRRRLYAYFAALAFVAAMASWRVSLVVLQLELVFVALAFLAGRADPALRDLWIAMTLVGTLGLLSVRYLAAHGFLVSPLWLDAAGLAVLVAVPRFARARWPVRLAALAIVAAAALLAGRATGTADYAGLRGMLALRLGLARATDPAAALLATVSELQSLPPARLLADPRVFSWLGALFVFSPLVFLALRRTRRDEPAPTPTLAPALLATLALGCTAATLLFQRSAVLLAPLVAIVAGGVFARTLDALARPAGRAVGGAALGVASLAAVSALAAGIDTAAHQSTQLAPNLRAAIAYVARESGPESIVLCDWDTGYDVQSLAGRATAVDGLLESVENRRRIVAFYAACMDSNADSLTALCRRCDARWLLLPPASAIYAMALVSDDPLASAIASGNPVPRGALTDRLVVHLIEGDREYPGLRRAHESGGYTVFEVEPEPVAQRSR